jgi:dihydroxy-acid dehydratase
MHSDAIKTGPDRAPARAMLRATGLDDAAIAKPLIAVVHSWSDVSPCNLNLRELAEHVRAGIQPRAACRSSSTPSPSPTASHGHAGHARFARLARVDRRLHRAGRAWPLPRRRRGAVRLRQDHPGRGDGAGPPRSARIDAVRRLDPARPPQGQDTTIQDVFEAVGAHAAGTIDDAELAAIEKTACPGAGACGGQFTANTMALATTFLGLAPMGANDMPAPDPAKPTRRGPAANA